MKHFELFLFSSNKICYISFGDELRIYKKRGNWILRCSVRKLQTKLVVYPSNNEVSAWPTQEDGTFLFPEICPNQGDRIIFGVTRASGAPAQVIWRNLLRFGIRPPWRKFASDVSAPIFCCPPLRSRGRRRSLRSGASRLRSGCAAVHARSAPSNRKCPLKRLQLTSATPASAKS